MNVGEKLLSLNTENISLDESFLLDLYFDFHQPFFLSVSQLFNFSTSHKNCNPAGNPFHEAEKIPLNLSERGKFKSISREKLLESNF